MCLWICCPWAAMCDRHDVGGGSHSLPSRFPARPFSYRRADDAKLRVGSIFERHELPSMSSRCSAMMIIFFVDICFVIRHNCFFHVFLWRQAHLRQRRRPRPALPVLRVGAIGMLVHISFNHVCGAGLNRNVFVIVVGVGVYPMCSW